MMRQPELVHIQLHDADCPCRSCRPRRGPAREVERLDAQAMGKLAVAGAAVGTAIAFAIDPAGAWAALADVIRSFG